MMKREAERRKQRRRERQDCPVHAYQKHGKEAEELRSGVEKIIQRFRAGGSDPEEVETLLEDLQELLDSVDARDSLAYLERIS